MIKKHNRIFYMLLTAVFWFAIWQTAAIIINQPLYMPSPFETFVALMQLIVTGKFWLSVAFTFYRVIMGIAISFMIGITLAYLSSRSVLINSLLRPLMAAAKSVPVMSVIVLALVWFGSSDVPIFACVLLCLPIFYTNTLAGIKSISNELLEMASVYNISRKRIITGISIPSVMPHIYSAFSICVGFSWKSVVAAEALSIPAYSMGFSLYATKMYLDTPSLFAWTVTIVIISLVIEKGLKRVFASHGSGL